MCTVSHQQDIEEGRQCCHRRVFGKATDSHRAMQSSAGVPEAVGHNPFAHDDDRMHRGAQERPEPPSADDAAGMVLPLPAPRRRFAHHGYQAARQELEDWRNVGEQAQRVCSVWAALHMIPVSWI